MADFETAIALTLENEGGFQKDPNDPGNWTGGHVGIGELVGTKYGISAADHPGVDIANLTTDQATEIYREEYWKALYSQIDDQGVANKLFDEGVNLGVGTAVRILQNVLNIDQDGAFGQETLSAVNQAGPGLLDEYKAALVARYTAIATSRPNEAKYLPDWLRRANS